MADGIRRTALRAERLAGPLLAGAALTTLAACGGGGSSATSTSATSTATDGQARKVAALEDLSDFSCTADADGTWSASGTVTNPTKKPADYRLTVLVTDGSSESPARSTAVPSVAPDAAADFEIARLPMTGTDPTCRVQVMRRR